MTPEQRNIWFKQALELVKTRIQNQKDYDTFHNPDDEDQEIESCPFQLFNICLQKSAALNSLTIGMEDTLFAIFECVKIVVEMCQEINLPVIPEPNSQQVDNIN